MRPEGNIMRNILVLAVLLVAARVEAGTETLHFTSCAQNTGNNATIAIKSSGAFANNLALQTGDEIAVVTPSGACVGAGVWTGANLAITVWGDDGATPAVDGLQVGQEYSFQIWSTRWNFQYPAPRSGRIRAHYESGPST